MPRRSSNENALGLFDPCCSTCPDGVESGFLKITDHYNSTINFFPKFAAFRTIDVCDEVRANQAKKCCTFENDRVTSFCEKKCPSFGFIDFPERAQFQKVDACGKVCCLCKGDHKNSCHETFDNCACDACRSPLASSLGFVNWPPRAYYHDVKACGKVNACLGKKCAVTPCKRKRRRRRRRRRRSS